MGKKKVGTKTITSQQAIDFVEVSIRQAADQMAQSYYAAVDLRDRWRATNDQDTFISTNDGLIRATADRIIQAQPTAKGGVITAVAQIDNVWFNVGDPALNAQIPNDPNELVDDSNSDVQPISGEDVHNLVARTRDLATWWETGQFPESGAGSPSSGEAMTNTVVVVGTQGNIPLQVPQVTAFIDGRLSELITDYEAFTNRHIDQILAVSINPQPR